MHANGFVRTMRGLLGGLLLAASAGAMELGSNFWNLKWHKPGDCFLNSKNVSGDNPWNPQFLKEIEIYGSFRFMDWDVVNNSKRATWSERPQQSNTNQTVAAYEWMIDLCNRMNADMWVCVPHRAVNRETGDRPADYALRLCLLIKTGVDMRETDLGPLLDRLSGMTADELVAAGGVKTCEPLKPELNMYIEYSNETWNGIFEQSHYCVEEGTALNLDPSGKPGNDGKLWGAGFRYHAWAAIRLFRAADLVWGAGSKRVVRVLAQQKGSDYQAGLHQQVLNDPRHNPWGLKADALAIAPYFGHKVKGDDPDIVEALRKAIQDMSAVCARMKAVANASGLDFIAYEGGQHVTDQPQAVNRDPVMYDLYTEYLNEMGKYFSVFSHYAHVGPARDGGAWGCIEFTGQPVEAAPKYRALRDWVGENAAPDSWQSWKLAHFGEDADDPDVGGPLASPAGDGIKNLAKYALGISPLLPGYQGHLDEGMMAVSGTNYFMLRYTRPEPAPADVSYQIRAGDRLTATNWVAEVTEVSSTVTNGQRTIIVRDTVPMRSAPQRFLMLQIIQQ